jgi:hypothetical protein
VANGESKCALAREYGVVNATVQRVVKFPDPQWRKNCTRRKYESRCRTNYIGRRKERDEGYRVYDDLRRSIHGGLDGSEKAARSLMLTGMLSWEIYRDYLMKPFPGKTFTDLRELGYQVHHIRPICSFDLRQPLEQFKAFHYANTQLVPGRINGELIGSRPLRYNLGDDSYQERLPSGRFGRRMTWEEARLVPPLASPNQKP